MIGSACSVCCSRRCCSASFSWAACCFPCSEPAAMPASIVAKLSKDCDATQILLVAQLDAPRKHELPQEIIHLACVHDSRTSGRNAGNHVRLANLVLSTQVSERLIAGGHRALQPRGLSGRL